MKEVFAIALKKGIVEEDYIENLYGEDYLKEVLEIKSKLSTRFALLYE